MKRDVDAHDWNCGGAAFEGDRVGTSGILGDVGADEGEEGGGVQVLGDKGVGGVGKSGEGLERAGADVLLELDVVVDNLKERVCFAGYRVDQAC